MMTGFEDQPVFEKLWSPFDEEEMQRLCTEQIQELSAMTARHAQDRVMLALRLRREAGM